MNVAVLRPHGLSRLDKMLALANQLYIALAAQGHARDGTQALELALAAMSGIDWRKRRTGERGRGKEEG